MIRHIFIPGLFAGLLFVLFASCKISPRRKPVLHTVVIKNMKFEPAILTVTKGDTVVWLNHDMVAHNVTEVVSNAWASPKIENGDSWKKVINESSLYYCSIHVVMEGKLIVE